MQPVTLFESVNRAMARAMLRRSLQSTELGARHIDGHAGFPEKPASIEEVKRPTHEQAHALEVRHPSAPPIRGISMSLSGFLQLALSTVIFLLAATMAKSWALAPGIGKLVLTLLLYSAGNLIMLRLVREFGMASAFSLSAVIQLVAVNVIALAWFNERLSVMQGSGIALAILAVGLITLGPAFGK